MGSIFGAGFQEGGHRTVLVDVAQPLVDRINADGVTIVGKDGTERHVRIPSTTEPGSVGPFEGESVEGAERLAQALTDGGFEAHVTTPIRPEIWKKLILNAATLPTASLAGMNAGALTAHASMHQLVSETAREAVAVARA